VTEDIIVIDDFLPQPAYDSLARLISAQPLAYGSRSNFKTDPHGHWSRDFVAAGPHNLADVADLLAADEAVAPVDAAWRFLRDTRLPDSVLVRCYLNGYTYGTDGYFHTDSQRPDEHTTILYINDYWEPDWAGESVFLGADGDIIKAVLPRHNRAIIFPAGTPHAGRSVSRKCMVLRKTLIFKARQKRGNDFEKLSTFLRKAGAVSRVHEMGSLHDHLVRTFSALEAKGRDRGVCFGGGLHAIYGTSEFKNGILPPDAKADVVGEFGERAENLAYLFSMLRHPATLESPLALNAETAVVELTDGQTLELPRGTFDDLRQIECANLADQGALARHRTLNGLWKNP
jgi:SM-20-related protein